MGKQNLPDFLIIPSILVVDREIQPLDREVYGLIYWYTKLKLQKCILSNQSIADYLGYSKDGVAHALSRLTQKGYVVSIKNDLSQRTELVPTVAFSDTHAQMNKGGMLKQAEGHVQTNNIIREFNNSKKNIKKERMITHPHQELNLVGNPTLCRLAKLSDGCGKCAYCSWTVCTPAQLYEIAEKKQVNYPEVNRIQDAVISWLQDKVKREGSMYRTIVKWLDNDIKDGRIRELDFFGMELMKMQYNPEVRREMDEARDKLRQAGKI